MKSVLISIQPKWCALIANGEKTIEVRKTAPKEVPFKCYIYETKFVNHCRGCEFYLFDCSGLGKAFDVCTYGDKPRITTLASRCWQDKYSGGKVIGEFVCDKVEYFSEWKHDYPSLLRHIDLYAGTNGDYKFLDDYLQGMKKGCGWHISDLKIYDKLKELSEFGVWCKEFEKEEPFCVDCDYQSIDWSAEPAFDCKCNGFKPLSRPPQSWCYCEEAQQ